MGEEYNGWSNRETWALNLWLGNDEGLYHATLENAKGAAGRGFSARRIGETIVSWVNDDLRDYMDPEQYATLRDEVGSLWRVDEQELGEAWLEQLGEEEGLAGSWLPLLGAAWYRLGERERI